MTRVFSSKYLELIRQREVIQSQIDLVKRRELDEILREIIKIMREFDISADELAAMLPHERRGGRRKGVAPKYMNLNTGETWSGRGRRPAWLKDKNLDDFRLDNMSANSSEDSTLNEAASTAEWAEREQQR
jgi:DNA-binding protein H-NS